MCVITQTTEAEKGYNILSRPEKSRGTKQINTGAAVITMKLRAAVGLNEWA